MITMTTEKLSYYEIIECMNQISNEEAIPIAGWMAKRDVDSELCMEWYIPDAKYYLAIKKLMAVYPNREYTMSCSELFQLGIPQSKGFVPCIAHSYLEREGYPCGCNDQSCRMNQLQPRLAVSA